MHLNGLFIFFLEIINSNKIDNFCQNLLIYGKRGQIFIKVVIYFVKIDNLYQNSIFLLIYVPNAPFCQNCLL